jgi:trehalose 6-phosphate phosphatase
MDDRLTERIKSARSPLLRGAELVVRCHACLTRRPSAIATDIDGTISEIAATPQAATVNALARQSLAQLADALDLVAAVTGRAAQDGEQLVNLPKLLYIGNHGLERRRSGQTEIDDGARSSVEAIRTALEEIRGEIESEGRAAGHVFENKLLSASIHYRLVDDPDEAGRRLRSIALRVAERRNLQVSEGRFVVEIRPKLTVNKGTAVEDLIRQERLHGMVFLGDDLTDVDAFRVVRRLTAEGTVEGCVIAVASPEVHQTVLNEADGVVSGVPEAAELLSDLAGSFTPVSTTADVAEERTAR